MQDYNHKANTIREAIGLDANNVIDKANSLFITEGNMSHQIEAMEKGLTKRELASLVHFLKNSLEDKTNLQP